MPKSQRNQRNQSRRRNRTRQSGGKNKWTDFVKSVHQDMKKKNKTASYKDAMIEAGKRYRK